MSDIRREMVTSALAAFLRRKSPPRGLSDADLLAERDAIVTGLLGSLPRDASDAVEVLNVALTRLEARSKFRTWPTAPDITALLREPGKGNAPGETGVGAKMPWVQRWWGDMGDLGPWAQDHAVIRALVDAGVSARALWDSGADVPRELRIWATSAADDWAAQ